MAGENFDNAAEILKKDGEFSSYTSGASMYPLFRTHRDIVNIKSPVFPLKRHDVPLYRVPQHERLVLHRIIKVLDDKTYLVRGDNTYRNEIVHENDIVGVLDSFYRKGKYCNCNSKGYRLYIAAMRVFYPVRFVYKRFFWPLLSKCKRLAVKVVRTVIKK